jgi:hypothetical protein
VSQTITLKRFQTRFADALPFELNATSTSDQAIIFESSDPTSGSIENSTVTIYKTGTVEIMAHQEETDYYATSSVVRRLTITKKPQTVAFGLPGVKSVSDTPSFTALVIIKSGKSIRIWEV